MLPRRLPHVELVLVQPAAALTGEMVRMPGVVVFLPLPVERPAAGALLVLLLQPHQGNIPVVGKPPFVGA